MVVEDERVVERCHNIEHERHQEWIVARTQLVHDQVHNEQEAGEKVGHDIKDEARLKLAVLLDSFDHVG